MDPYAPPQASSEENVGARIREGEAPGQLCTACGSANTSAGNLLKPKTGFLGFLLFGWFFILIRGAFRKEEVLCYDCGITHRYRPPSARIFMGILIFIIGLILLVALTGGFS
jgi:hypothetical protein